MKFYRYYNHNILQNQQLIANFISYSERGH